MATGTVTPAPVITTIEDDVTTIIMVVAAVKIVIVIETKKNRPLWSTLFTLFPPLH
jgi:hypothetical protein